MIKGTIIKVAKGKSGVIQGDNEGQYRFNRKRILHGTDAQIHPGRRVEFEPDGEWASKIYLLDEVQDMTAYAHSQRTHIKAGKGHPEPVSSSPYLRKTGRGYRFLNPYNFVRYIEQARPENHVLGNCEPPPHDRYVGLTGRITCRLTAKSPIFVSDSHGVYEEELSSGKKHPHVRFFRTPDGHIAIPASTLRGVIRTIFEIATNSCFMHFRGEKHLSYHLPPKEALKLVPARVEEQNGKYYLHLLPGTTPIVVGAPPAGPQYAAWVYFYTPLRKSKTALKRPKAPYSVRKRLQREGWKHGEEAYALIELVEHPLRHFRFWNVIQLAKDRNNLPKPKDDQKIVKGYLCINNQNIENKHDERFFFRDPGNTSLEKPLPLSPEVVKRYEELIADYQERHADEIRKRREPDHPDFKARKPALSRHILQEDHKLKDGDLVYAMLSAGPFGPEIEFLVPVAVPRILYKQMLLKLLPKYLHPCTDYSSLCPACRVFGWVHPNASEKKPEERTAYAGRVRFSHAVKVEDSPQTPFDVTLAILSTPKPTTFRFYLRPQRGKPQNGQPDDQLHYDAPGQVLRGRKVYRCHRFPLDPKEYQSPQGHKSDQNRTVHEVQPPGTVFEFTVEFENLAPEELGALLWSLEMEGWHHRIGYAKPLGFGEAPIQVVGLQIMDVSERYSSLEPHGGWIDAFAHKAAWIHRFKEEIAKVYSAPSFDDLPNIRDLRALLGQSPSLPVHYPRSTKEPQPEGRNYEWFLGNKRGGRNAGPRLVLPLAEDDIEGFPLIDRQGNIVEDE